MQAIDLNNTAAFATAGAASAQIQTVEAATPAGMFKLEWTRRSTDKNPVTTHERVRIAFVPEGLLLIDRGATASKYVELLQSTIHRLATDKFVETLKRDPQTRSVSFAAFTVDAVLAFWAEERESQRLTNAAIADWLKQSKTLAALPEAKRAIWLQRIPQFAAPLWQRIFTQTQAASIVAQLDESDMEHTIAQTIIQRCNIILNTEPEADAL